MDQIENIANEINLLGDSKVIGYDAGTDGDKYDAGCFCDTCDCVCNQPCHGEGPCYSL